MGKEPLPVVEAPGPSFARFILWEIVGIVGFFHILLYAPANDPTPLYFLVNAIVFIGLYPAATFFHEFKFPAVLKLLVEPLHIVLRLLLLATGYIWCAYILYSTEVSLGSIPCFQIAREKWMFLVPLFALDYFFFLEHMWGLSRVNFRFWPSLGMISDSVSGVVGGYVTGHTLFVRWGLMPMGVESQALTRSLFILTGVAVVVWFGNKTRQAAPAAPQTRPSLSSGRFIFWEVVGVAGFLHILHYSPTGDPTFLLLKINAFVSLMFFAVLCFYDRLRFPSPLRFTAKPLRAGLRFLLAATGYGWLIYFFYASSLLLGPASCFIVFKAYWPVLAPVFILGYAFSLEHLLGVSGSAFTFWASLGMISDSVSGVFGGYMLGRILNSKWGMFFGDLNIQGLVWSLFILTGLAVVVWFGNRTRKG